MKTLNAHIKSKEFISLYLLFGDESYLKRFYENKFKEKILPDAMEMMNFDFYEGKNISPDTIADAVQTLPFMSEQRLVLVKNSGLFATGRKDDTSKMTEIVKDIPETTVLLFIEDNIDKRNGLYKLAAKAGYSCELSTPKENELIEWVIKLFKNSDIKISKPVAAQIVRTVANDMSTIEQEVLKLSSFKEKGSTLTTEDVELLCTKSLETRIFDLIDAVGTKQLQKAMEMYANLMTMKESPIMVLTMISRQLRLILQCREMEKSCSQEEIASKLGIRSFVVSQCLRQGRNFSKETLLKAVDDCLKTDVNIKTGKIQDKLAVEMILVKYASQKHYQNNSSKGFA